MESRTGHGGADLTSSAIIASIVGDNDSEGRVVKVSIVAGAINWSAGGDGGSGCSLESLLLSEEAQDCSFSLRR